MLKSAPAERLLQDRLHRIVQQAGPNTVALEHGQVRLSYGDLQQRVVSLAEWMTSRPEHVIALWSDNSIEWVLSDLACQMANKVCLPIPNFFSEGQLQHCLATVDLLLADQLLPVEACNHFQVVPVDAPLMTLSAWSLLQTESQAPQTVLCDDIGEHRSEGLMPIGTAKITFTSGSTGNPKGVCLSVAHQWQVAESLAQVIEVESPRHLCLLPLATLLENLAGIYVPLLKGGCVVLATGEERGLSGSSAVNLAQMSTHIQSVQPATMILLPQLLAGLIVTVDGGWHPPASLRFIAVGGGKVSPLMLEKSRRLGLPVYEGYGLSECGSVVALNRPGVDRLGSVGQVLPHCEVSLQNDEVIVRGSCFLGYWGQPESWYPQHVATGDLGELNHHWLCISGRQKNLIITSFGRNISPEWVESALSANPLFRLCVVTGEARPFLVALLFISEKATPADIDMALQQTNASMPDYAQVRRWIRASPQEWSKYVTANGRPQREKLIAAYQKIIDVCYDDLALAGPTMLCQPV